MARAFGHRRDVLMMSFGWEPSMFMRPIWAAEPQSLQKMRDAVGSAAKARGSVNGSPRNEYLLYNSAKYLSV